MIRRGCDKERVQRHVSGQHIIGQEAQVSGEHNMPAEVCRDSFRDDTVESNVKRWAKEEPVATGTEEMELFEKDMHVLGMVAYDVPKRTNSKQYTSGGKNKARAQELRRFY